MGQPPDRGIAPITLSAAQLGQLRLAILVGAPIPGAMRGYVASLIPDTTPARGRGHPKNTMKQQAERWMQVAALDCLVRFVTAEHKRDRKEAPRGTALAEVALANGMDADSLKKAMAKFKRDAPASFRHMYPSDRTITFFLHEHTGRGDASINALLAQPSEGF